MRGWAATWVMVGSLLTALALHGGPASATTSPVDGATTTADVENVYRRSSDGRFLEVTGPTARYVRDTVLSTTHQPDWVGLTVDPAPGCTVDQTLSLDGALITLSSCTKKATRTWVSSYGLDGTVRSVRLHKSKMPPGLDATDSFVVWPKKVTSPRRVFDVRSWSYRRVLVTP